MFFFKSRRGVDALTIQVQASGEKEEEAAEAMVMPPPPVVVVLTAVERLVRSLNNLEGRLHHVRGGREGRGG